MPKVRVRQLAALQLQTHKVGRGLQVRGAQLLTQCRVHAIADHSQVGGRNVLYIIAGLVQDAGDSLPILPLFAVLCMACVAISVMVSTYLRDTAAKTRWAMPQSQQRLHSRRWLKLSMAVC